MAKDPYRYFRIEARELVESLRQGVVGLEKNTASRELLSQILRLAHTLKGAARVVKHAEIAELAHAIEEVLTPLRESRASVSSEVIEKILRMLDAIAVQVTALGTPEREQPQAGSAPAMEQSFEAVRVDIAEIDVLLEQLSTMRVQIDSLQRKFHSLEELEKEFRYLAEESPPHVRSDRHTKTRPYAAAEDTVIALSHLRRTAALELERLERQAALTCESANQLRLLPASIMFSSLEIAVRDAAQVIQRRVEFHTEGGNIRLDAHVLVCLRDALLHVVRNAVAHGIEPEGVREAQGKSPTGRIELNVARRGGRVAFVCRDDGRGVDVDAVRRVVVERKLVTPEEGARLDLPHLIQLLLRGGVSTTKAVTEISGRGIGLDVVRDTTTRLKGDLSIHSQAGRGTTVEMCVPYSLSSLKMLLLKDGSTHAALPLDAIQKTLQIRASNLLHSPEGDAIANEDQVVPFMPLAKILASKAPHESVRNGSAVIVQSGSRTAAIGVERLLGTMDLIVHPLPAHMHADTVLCGASLNEEGVPIVVLSAPDLVHAIVSRRGATVELTPIPRAPVLVIDDSLTTRMLEQSILESAGYDVELATSAEEGLVKARARRFGLFLVDVEMPGMDGFQFIEQIRADPILRQIPAILVTSRNAPEDRRRGENAGAQGYVIKSEFDQSELLKRIHDLIGA